MSYELELVQGDINIENGYIKLVNKGNKLFQQVAKVLNTPKGGYFHPEYGSDIYSLIGRYQDKEILTPLSTQSVLAVLMDYQRSQKSQEIFQDMDDEEVLLKLVTLEIEPLDNIGYTVKVQVMNRKLQTINVSTNQGY